MTSISTNSIEKAKQAIKKALELNEKPIIVEAQDDNFNRKLLEYGKFDILCNIEYNRKDSPRQLDSGLNDFLAGLASKNKVSIGTNLEKLRNLGKKEKSIILARIKQNIKICRKAKAKIKLLNYNDKPSAQAFLLSIGSSTQQAKEAVEE